MIALTWASYSRLDREAAHELVFAGGGGRVALQNIRVSGPAYAASPGAHSDISTAFIVPLADRRLIAAAGPLLTQDYNLRLPGGSDYVAASENAGTPWTWATMLEDIWDVNGMLGTWPGLPAGFGPDGTPENFAFDGTNSYSALNVVLDVLGCALRLNPTADTFSVVEVAETDATAEAALVSLARRKIWDAYPDEAEAPRLPETIRVTFPAFWLAPENPAAQPTYTVDVAGGDDGAQEDTILVLPDSLAARYDEEGDLSNSAALATRAAERAETWYRRAREGRLARVYSGIAGDILPCSRIKGTSWRDYGGSGGTKTSVSRHPGFTAGGPFAPLDGSRGPGEPAATPAAPGASVVPGAPAVPGAFGPGATPAMPGNPMGPGGGHFGLSMVSLLPDGTTGGAGAPMQFGLAHPGAAPWQFGLGFGVGGPAAALAAAVGLPLLYSASRLALSAASGPAPPAPAGTPGTTAGDAQVALTWSASVGPPDAAYYIILVSTDSGMANATVAGTTATLAFSVTGLTNGTPYYFSIVAVGEPFSLSIRGGYSAMSAIATATPTATSPPPCSTSNTYTATVSGSTGADGTYNLTWSSGQFWFASSGGVNVGMDLSVSPPTLDFTIPFMATAHYEKTPFDCATGATFDYVSDTGTDTWPATVAVTSP